MQIEWVCQVCSKSVGDESGYVFINEEEALEAEREDSGDVDDDRPSAQTIYELVASTNTVSWKIVHSACDTEDDEVLCYRIDVERVRTPQQLLAWTAQLMDKSWLPWTNWSQTIKKVATDLGVKAI
jgi:hypothetical protein